MKCSSRRNCNRSVLGGLPHVQASMKCSSRRNCNRPSSSPTRALARCLNEVQFPEELQPGQTTVHGP